MFSTSNTRAQQFSTVIVTNAGNTFKTNLPVVVTLPDGTKIETMPPEDGYWVKTPVPMEIPSVVVTQPLENNEPPTKKKILTGGGPRRITGGGPSCISGGGPRRITGGGPRRITGGGPSCKRIVQEDKNVVPRKRASGINGLIESRLTTFRELQAAESRLRDIETGATVATHSERINAKKTYSELRKKFYRKNRHIKQREKDNETSRQLYRKNKELYAANRKLKLLAQRNKTAAI